MENYKLHGNGVLRTTDNAIIPNDAKNCDWKIYQQWLTAGNTPDPEYTIDELQTKVVNDIGETANAKVDVVTSTNPRAKRKAMMKSIKWLRKETKGIASQTELNQLDAQEAISDYIEELEATTASNIAWAQDPARTEAELIAFNPETNITWPNPPA